MKTGKEIWKEKFADFKEGYTGVISPLVANPTDGGRLTVVDTPNDWPVH
jgi:hypothetical protein